MDQVWPILLVIVVFGLVAVGAYFAHKAHQKRLQELARLARDFQLQFRPGDDEPQGEHAMFSCFRRGFGRRQVNSFRGRLPLLTGCAESPILMGDYRYKETSGSGKNRRTTTHHFSYLMVQVPWPVPGLAIRREHVFDKLAGALGFDDIDFESEEFSRKYHVKCRDRKLAFDVIHPRMMEFLLGANPPPIEFSTAWCCITDGSSSWNPEQFRWNLQFVQAFFGHWPEHLIRDLDSRHGEDIARSS